MKNKIVIFSGAGLSAESGLQTFRSSEGLWNNYDIDVVCNFNNWITNFDIVHEFYNKRREELATVKPNIAHQTIANIQNRYGKERVKIITQNVDDLLERAGCVDVLHVHGELTKIWCPKCKNITDIGYKKFDFTPCKQCSSKFIKPFVVFFYEQAPLYKQMYEEFEALRSGDIALVIGTSGQVISLHMLVGGLKCHKILNNLEECEFVNEDLFDEIFYESSITAMPKIKEMIYKRFD